MSKLHPKDYEEFITPELDHEREEALKHNKKTPYFSATLPENILARKDDNGVLPELHHAYENHPHHYVTKKIKSDQYRQTIADTQQSLLPSQRQFSSFMHQTTIEQISEVVAKTIARPIGIVGGAFVALLGSSLVLYVANHVGFSVPATIFAILFIAGYIAGVLFELFVYMIKRVKNKDHRPTHY